MHRHFFKGRGKTFLFFTLWLMAQLRRAEKLTAKCLELAFELAWLCQPSAPWETGLSHQLCPSSAPHWSLGTRGRFGADGDGRKDPNFNFGISGYPHSAHLAGLMKLCEMLHWQSYALFDGFLSLFCVSFHLVMNTYAYFFIAIIRFVSWKTKLNPVLFSFILVFLTLSTSSES